MFYPLLIDIRRMKSQIQTHESSLNQNISESQTHICFVCLSILRNFSIMRASFATIAAFSIK